MSDTFDSRMMRRAITLARRGQGRVEPNPMVGCIFVRRGRVIGESFHRRFGGPHAEVEALRRCTSDPRGATVYVSLEPCCHYGKTPPCTPALISAGVAQVIIGTIDPNPLVAGRGVRALRRAGIGVRIGPGESEAVELIAPYATRLCLGRPYVIAKWAQSVDGRIARPRGESQWISGETSRRQVHRLRARVDAILVGCGTVQADDPLLTARDVPVKRRALRVVLDGRLRIPEKCRLVVTSGEQPTLVLTTARQSARAKAHRLARKGVEVVGLRSRGDRLPMRAVLRTVARRGVTNLLVEGGGDVLTQLLEARLVDEAMIYVAPILIGGTHAPGPFGERSVDAMTAALGPRHVRVQRCGTDWLYRMRLNQPVPARVRAG